MASLERSAPIVRLLQFMLLVCALSATAQAQPFAKWVTVTNGVIPVNAFVGGNIGVPENICRGTHQGGTHPGKTSNNWGRCYIEFAGAEVGLTTYEVLVDFGGAWVAASGGSIPAGSFQTGTESGSSLFSCRAYLAGGIHIGKIRSGFTGCNIGNNTAGVTVARYEVLKNVWVVASGGNVPANAFVAGNEANGGANLYICRGAFGGGIHPGKVRPGFAEGCLMAFNAQSVSALNYEVLTTDLPSIWLAGSGTTPPIGTFNAGFDGIGGLLSSCRATVQGGLHPGKIGGQVAGGCRIEFGGVGTTVANYETLIVQAADLSGTHRIRVKANDRFWVEAGTGDKLISTRTQVDDAFARFTLQKQANGTYKMIVSGSGRHTHEDPSSDKVLSTRFQPDDDFTRFYFEQQANGSYRIRVRGDNRYLHEDGNGDKLVSARFQSDDDFVRFHLEPASTLSAVAPALTSVVTTPGSLVAGQQFALTVNGTNFDPASAIVSIAVPGADTRTFSGAALTSVTAEQIKLNVTLGTAGTASVSVKNGPAGTASNTLTLTVGAAQGCVYSLSQTTFTPASDASEITVTVTVTGSNCNWTVGNPSLSFVTVVSGSTGGTTNGSVKLGVAANPTATSRSATITIAEQTVTITQAAGGGVVNPGTGLRFVKVEPCRIMETRPEYVVGLSGALGPPFLAATETRTLPVPSSPCGIPASAKAYVLNVTVVPRPTVDFVTVFPAGEARPQYFTVRSPDGQWVANSAIVKAGVGGAISVFASHATDMVIDVSGYFTDDANLSNLVFYPLPPCRVIDTRALYRPENNLTGFGPTTMGDQATRRFRFPATPYCQIPQGAAAYSVTITVDPLAKPLAFLTAWPASASRPNVSNINSPAGRILANSVIVPASADGSIDVFAYNRTDFIMDINGYFAPDNGQGLFYFPVTQCRAGDTTVAGSPLGAIFGNDTTRSVALPGVPGCSGIPNTAKAYAINVTATPNGSPMPFITAYPTGSAKPIASILNAFEGQTVSNSAIVPAGTGGAIDIYAYLRTNVVLEVSGFFGR